MAERHIDFDSSRFGPPTHEEEEFDPETASVYDLSIHITKLAGRRDPTDITNDQTYTSWPTGIDDISCSLSTWEIEHEPAHLLVVSSKQKNISYSYGAYMDTIQYTDTDTSAEMSDQAEIEERLARVLRHGYKQVAERQIYNQFDEISGRIAVEEVIEKQQRARTLLGRIANTQATLDSTTLLFLDSLHGRDNQFRVPGIVFKTEMMRYCTEYKPELRDLLSSRQSLFRHMLERFKRT